MWLSCSTVDTHKSMNLHHLHASFHYIYIFWNIFLLYYLISFYLYYYILKIALLYYLRRKFCLSCCTSIIHNLSSWIIDTGKDILTILFKIWSINYITCPNYSTVCLCRKKKKKESDKNWYLPCCNWKTHWNAFESPIHHSKPKYDIIR